MKSPRLVLGLTVFLSSLVACGGRATRDADGGGGSAVGGYGNGGTGAHGADYTGGAGATGGVATLGGSGVTGGVGAGATATVGGASVGGVGGGASDLGACERSEECLVTSLDCCDPCDPVDADTLVAINLDHVAALRARLGCGDVQCEQCLPVAPNAQTRKYLYPACVEGQCTVRDLRESPLAECDTAADCTLRCGARCCPNCSAADGVIAHRVNADLRAEFCGDLPSSCDDCACQIPPEYAAECVDARCVAVIGPICGPGTNQDCNADPLMSRIAGTCNPDGTCTCDVWIEPATGRCL